MAAAPALPCTKPLSPPDVFLPISVADAPSFCGVDECPQAGGLGMLNLLGPQVILLKIRTRHDVSN